MTDVLVDFHLAQGMAEAQNKDVDVMRYKYVQSVLKKYHIDEATFDSSMVYYSGRAEEFTHIYNNVLTRVRAQAERLGLETESHDRFASLTSEGDTANIWLGKDFACVVPGQVQNLYSFQLKADTTFRPGDSFIWRFRTQFVARGMSNEAVALLNFYYEGDTVASVSELLRTSPKNELWHRPGRELDTVPLRSVSGFVFLPTDPYSDVPKPMLISEIQLIRMHKRRVEESVQQPLDTLQADTLTEVTQDDVVRLTPRQLRESQPRERRINVVKENPNPIHPERGIPTRANRRRR